MSNYNYLIKLEKRLQNTEKALFALVTVLEDLQPPSTQDNLRYLMNEYYDANTSLGFKPTAEFEIGEGHFNG